MKIKKSKTEARYEAIKDLVTRFKVIDQKQLVDLLRQHYHIDTNQSVVSRDLRMLGMVKKAVGGATLYELPDVDVSTEILRLAIIDVSYNETTIVIKTYPALADFVGDRIDQHDDLDILGCLAGENIVFVVPKSIKKITQVYEQLCEKLKYKTTG